MVGYPVARPAENRRSVAVQLPSVSVRITTLVLPTTRHVVALGQSMPAPPSRAASRAGVGWPWLTTTKTGVLVEAEANGGYCHR